MTAARPPLRFAHLAAALAACGTPAASSTVDLASPSVADAAATTGDAIADCDDDLGDRARGGTCVHTVSGQLVTESGAPLAGATVTCCASACFYGMSDEAGRFTIPIHKYIRVEEYSVLTHVNPRRAAYYLDLPAPNGMTIDFPAPIPAPLMPAEGPVIVDNMEAQAVDGDGVDLFIEADTLFFFSFEDTSDLPRGHQLRPWHVTDYSKLPFAAALAPLALYGFGPFEMEFRKKARVSFDNHTGLGPGAAVEVWSMRGLLRGTPPGSKFDMVATAHVSPDGKKVELDPGTGLDALTWIALKKP